MNGNGGRRRTVSNGQGCTHKINWTETSLRLRRRVHPDRGTQDNPAGPSSITIDRPDLATSSEMALIRATTRKSFGDRSGRSDPGAQLALDEGWASDMDLTASGCWISGVRPRPPAFFNSCVWDRCLAAFHRALGARSDLVRLRPSPGSRHRPALGQGVGCAAINHRRKGIELICRQEDLDRVAERASLI